MLATLPPKHEVDKLIHQFFDLDTFPITTARELFHQAFPHSSHPEALLAILHEPTFMQEVRILPRDRRILFLILATVFGALARPFKNPNHMARLAFLHSRHSNAFLPPIQ